MKLFKKFASFVLAFAMVMAIAMPSVVKAAGSGSITITGAKAGHTFEAYQIFAGDASGNTLSNIVWGSGVTEAGQTTLGDAKTAAKTLNEEADAKVFADKVAQYLSDVTKESGNYTNGKYVIGGLEPGYYLVKDKGPVTGNDAYTKFILKVVGENEEVKVKINTPTSEKKVMDIYDPTGVKSDWQDSADYDIGDKVPFQLTGTVADDYNSYKGDYQLVFHDTLSAGLTVDRNSFKVYKNNGETPIDSSEYEINYESDQKFTVTIKNVKNLGNDVLKVRVEYKAELNTDAVIGAVGNPNTMYMEFSNNPNSTQGGEKGQTPEDKVKVFTYKVVINKVNSDNEPLKGAAFKLEKVTKDSNVLVKDFTLDRNPELTVFEFTGLDAGEYILTETVTPEGYNTMEPVKFRISSDHEKNSADPQLVSLKNLLDSGITFTSNVNEGSLTTNVVNYKGSELPSTGGMGTTVLYVAGTIMILAAGVFLVMKKKAENN